MKSGPRWSPSFFHDGYDLGTFVHGAAERNHDVEVLEAVFFTNLADRLDFQTKSSRVFRIVVTGSPSPAKEGTRFMGFKFFPTLKVAVFAGLEIAEAQGNRRGAMA